jgi:hypothetical protein
MVMTPTQQLKQELWNRFGSTEHPAEWDGIVYGGGKLSQRFWEYFKAIELLDLDNNSIVLDIGGGSPKTGVGFFAALMAKVVKHVYIVDPQIGTQTSPPQNVTFIRNSATFDDLQQLFTQVPFVTHVTSLSVFEHVEASVREGIMRAVNEFFQGSTVVATLEFHAKRTYFEQQLTTATLSALFQPLTRFYLDEWCAAPVWCENAFSDPGEIPRWYPLALRFRRQQAPNPPTSLRANTRPALRFGQLE